MSSTPIAASDCAGATRFRFWKTTASRRTATAPAALYSRIAPSVNASKPAGEWQSYDIRLVGRTLSVIHNGIKVLDNVEVDGLTAIANNSDEAEPGPFIIQGDHSYVEIKSFLVTPLVKK